MSAERGGSAGKAPEVDRSYSLRSPFPGSPQVTIVTEILREDSSVETIETQRRFTTKEPALIFRRLAQGRVTGDALAADEELAASYSGTDDPRRTRHITALRLLLGDDILRSEGIGPNLELELKGVRVEFEAETFEEYQGLQDLNHQESTSNKKQSKKDKKRKRGKEHKHTTRVVDVPDKGDSTPVQSTADIPVGSHTEREEHIQDVLAEPAPAANTPAYASSSPVPDQAEKKQSVELPVTPEVKWPEVVVDDPNKPSLTVIRGKDFALVRVQDGDFTNIVTVRGQKTLPLFDQLVGHPSQQLATSDIAFAAYPEITNYTRAESSRVSVGLENLSSTLEEGMERGSLIQATQSSNSRGGFALRELQANVAFIQPSDLELVGDHPFVLLNDPDDLKSILWQSGTDSLLQVPQKEGKILQTIQPGSAHALDIDQIGREVWGERYPGEINREMVRIYLRRVARVIGDTGVSIQVREGSGDRPTSSLYYSSPDTVRDVSAEPVEDNSFVTVNATRRVKAESVDRSLPIADGETTVSRPLVGMVGPFAPEAPEADPEFVTTVTEWKRRPRVREHNPDLPTLNVQYLQGETIITRVENDQEVSFTDPRTRAAIDYILRFPQEDLTKAEVLDEMPEEVQPELLSFYTLKQKLEDRLGFARRELFPTEDRGHLSTFSLDANVAVVADERGAALQLTDRIPLAGIIQTPRIPVADITRKAERLAVPSGKVDNTPTQERLSAEDSAAGPERLTDVPQTLIIDGGYVIVQREGEDPRSTNLKAEERILLELLVQQPGVPLSADEFRGGAKYRGIDLRSFAGIFSSLRNALEGNRAWSALTFTRDHMNRPDEVTLLMDQVTIKKHDGSDAIYMAPWMVDMQQPHPAEPIIPPAASSIEKPTSGSQIELGVDKPHLTIDWDTGAVQALYKGKTELLDIRIPAARVLLRWLVDHPDVPHSESDLENVIDVVSDERIQNGLSPYNIDVGRTMNMLQHSFSSILPSGVNVIDVTGGRNSGDKAYQITATTPSTELVVAEKVPRREAAETENGYDALPPLVINPDNNALSVGTGNTLNYLPKQTRAMLELLDSYRHTEVGESAIRAAMKAAGSTSGYIGPALYQGVLRPMQQQGYPVDQYFEIRKKRSLILGITFHGRLDIEREEVDPEFVSKVIEWRKHTGEQGLSRESVEGRTVTSHLTGPIDMAVFHGSIEPFNTRIVERQEGFISGEQGAGREVIDGRTVTSHLVGPIEMAVFHGVTEPFDTRLIERRHQITDEGTRPVNKKDTGNKKRKVSRREKKRLKKEEDSRAGTAPTDNQTGSSERAGQVTDRPKTREVVEGRTVTSHLVGPIEMAVFHGTGEPFDTHVYEWRDASERASGSREDIATKSIDIPMVGTIELAESGTARPEELFYTRALYDLPDLFMEAEQEFITRGYERREQGDASLPTLLVKQTADKTIIIDNSGDEVREAEFTDPLHRSALNFILRNTRTPFKRSEIIAELPDDEQAGNLNMQTLRRSLEAKLGRKLFIVEGHARGAMTTLEANVDFLTDEPKIDNFHRKPVIDDAGYTHIPLVGEIQLGEKKLEPKADTSSGSSEDSDFTEWRKRRKSTTGGRRSSVGFSDDSNFVPRRIARRAADIAADAAEPVEVTVLEHVEDLYGTTERHAWTEEERFQVLEFINNLGEGQDQAKSLSALRDAVWPDRQGSEMSDRDITDVIRFAVRADYSLRSIGEERRVRARTDEDGKMAGYYLEEPASETQPAPQPKAGTEAKAPEKLPTRGGRPLTNREISDMLEERAQKRLANDIAYRTRGKSLDELTDEDFLQELDSLDAESTSGIRPTTEQGGTDELAGELDYMRWIDAAKANLMASNGSEEGWGMMVFNNLSLHLDYPEGDDRLSRRKFIQQQGNWEIPYGEQPGYQGETNYSAEFLRMTPADFYGVFDASMERHGITQEMIEPHMQERDENKDALYEILLPVYADMRAAGLKHYPDLTV